MASCVACLGCIIWHSSVEYNILCMCRKENYLVATFLAERLDTALSIVAVKVGYSLVAQISGN